MDKFDVNKLQKKRLTYTLIKLIRCKTRSTALKIIICRKYCFEFPAQILFSKQNKKLKNNTPNIYACGIKSDKNGTKKL